LALFMRGAAALVRRLAHCPDDAVMHRLVLIAAQTHDTTALRRESVLLELGIPA
jgi:hypothetical protein